jgi:hypothetical protein
MKKVRIRMRKMKGPRSLALGRTRSVSCLARAATKDVRRREELSTSTHPSREEEEEEEVRR